MENWINSPWETIKVTDCVLSSSYSCVSYLGRKYGEGMSGFVKLLSCLNKRSLSTDVRILGIYRGGSWSSKIPNSFLVT